ncbi:hypothetical protein Tco_1375900 [Tanacetum coccineum]
MKNNVPPDCESLSLFQYSFSLPPRFILGCAEWEVCDSNTGSVVATENTGSNVVGMENEDSDGDGTVIGWLWGTGDSHGKGLGAQIKNSNYSSTETLSRL